MGLTWKEICDDPVLRDLPFKIESDRWGRIVMMPPPGYFHADYAGEIMLRLDRLMKGGRARTEMPVATADGTKAVDVAWLSDSRVPRREAYAVLTTAPEICVEVLSPSNTRPEMEERRRLFFERGAQEVWFCDLEGRLEFHAPGGPLTKSRLCPKFPKVIKT